MKIFYVTPESPLAGEGKLLSSMIAAGVERVHLRHPNCSLDEIRAIMEDIPSDMRSRLSLHDFHQLAMDYGCGIHLNRRNPKTPLGYHGLISRSCHSLEEIAEAETTIGSKEVADYYFLSPFFDSISKPGYKATQFDADALRQLLRSTHIVALGGVTPAKFDILKSLGFNSVALSGYLTGEGRRADILKRLKLCFNS